jgi:hypothetical protein
VHGTGCAALATVLPGNRPPRRAWGSLCQVEETVDVFTPLPVHVWRCRLSRGLWSNSLAAMRGPLGAGTNWATEARSAAHSGATREAALGARRREVCGAVDATSSPIRRPWGPFPCAIAALHFDQTRTRPKTPT